MTRLEQLAALGQSVWLDFIRRPLFTTGELQTLVDDGLRGMTSNPTIFARAIAQSDDYDEAIKPLAAQGRSVNDIYETLALEDIRRAADILRPVYDRTAGLDGYVSLEVNPHLACDAEGTVAEARRLFASVARPNLMIKVPARPQGLPAIETLIGEGINVNVTLIFALDQYQAVIGAYLAGLERLAAAGGDLSRVASVASFFVSRIDTAVDRQLDHLQTLTSNDLCPDPQSLKGKAAIASAKVAYALFREALTGERWQRLAAQGARVQRLLWASTSTKNPAYPDTLYVDNLIGPHTVNTMPPETLVAFREHGIVALTLEQGVDQARAHLACLAQRGIDLAAVTRQLLDDGVAAFARSFDSLLASIRAKMNQVQDI